MLVEVPRDKIGEVIAMLANDAHAAMKEEARDTQPERPRRGGRPRKEVEEKSTVTTKAFDEETFRNVIELFTDLGQTQQVAAQLKLPLEEVNRAVRFKAYGWYVKRREVV